MKKLFLVLTALVMSLTVFADVKPQRVVVLGDDPMMASDEASGAVGYATALQGLFDDQVTVDVHVSPTLLPDDPAALLEPVQKGDIIMLCKLPLATATEQGDERVQSDVYAEQLEAIQKAAQKRGAKVIWLTQACPRYFTYDSVQVHRQGVFPETIRRMCKRDLLPIVDVEQIVFDRLSKQGLHSSAALFLPMEPAIPAAAEKASREGLLLNEQGAREVAELIGEAIRADKKNPLQKRLR